MWIHIYDFGIRVLNLENFGIYVENLKFCVYNMWTCVFIIEFVFVTLGYFFISWVTAGWFWRERNVWLRFWMQKYFAGRGNSSPSWKQSSLQFYHKQHEKENVHQLFFQNFSQIFPKFPWFFSTFLEFSRFISTSPQFLVFYFLYFLNFCQQFTTFSISSKLITTLSNSKYRFCTVLHSFDMIQTN